MPTPQSKPQPEANPYMQMMQEDATADQGNPYSLGAPDTKMPPPAPSQPGMMERVGNKFNEIMAPSPPEETGLNRFAHGFMRSSLQPIAHPLNFIGGMAKEAFPPTQTSMAASIKPYEQSSHPTLDFAADQAGGLADSAVMNAGLGAGVRGFTGAKNFLRPTPSPEIVPPAEMAARGLTKAILPANKDATSFINAAPLEVPNILQHARETGNPLNTQLEFSKAAEGNASNARDFYENQVLKPNDKTVQTTGTGFGRRTGESPETFAKLSDIDKRIVHINKELSPAYGKLNVGDTREALAGRTALEHEVNSLTDILHRNLSQATGIPPEDIANLRQRVGRSFELANDTNAAVTSRMQGEGRTKLADLKMSNIPARFLETIRGGPTAISDRAFQRAIKNYPGEAQPLPQIKPQAAEIPPPTAGPKYPSLRSVRQDRETK